MKGLLLYIPFILLIFFTLPGAKAQSQTVANSAITLPVNFQGSGCTFNWVNDNPIIGLAKSGSGNIPAFTAVNTGTTPIKATITASPVATGSAYIANYGSSNVSVISTVTNTVIATIPVGANPFGVSASQDGNLVYVTNEGSNSVSVISTLTNTVTAIIPVGSNPKGVIVSADGTRVYVANSGSNTISVIDAATNTVINNIPVGQAPYGVTVSPDGTKVYTTNYNSKSVSVINPSTNSVVATVPVELNPTGITVSPDGNSVYVSNQGANTVMTISTASNLVTATVGVIGAPAGLVVSPDGTKVYVAILSGGFLTIIFPANNSTVNTRAAAAPESISLTPDGSTIYMSDIGTNGVDFFGPTLYTGGFIKVGLQPYSFGNFISPSPGCNGSPVTFTITVNPSPVITASPVTGSISSCAGTASSAPNLLQFTASGSGLSGDITARAPTGFEVSLSAGSGYSNTVTLPQSGGNVSNVPVYIRSSATVGSGNISGNVILSATGAAPVNVAVNATTKALPVANVVPNQSVFSGMMTAPVTFGGTGNGYIWVNDTPGIGLAASGTGDIASFKAVSTGNSPVTATITATPVSTAFAYIPGNGSDYVTVINTITNTTAGNIPVNIGPEGVAVSPDGSRVYVTNENVSGITVISTATNTVINVFPVGKFPFGLAVSPDGKKLYVANQADNTVSVINTATYATIATIAVGNNPYGVAVSPDGSRVYVTNLGGGNVSVINTTTNSVASTIGVGPSPDGIAVSPDGTRVYVANNLGSSISVISTATTSVVATIPVGPHTFGVAVSPDSKNLYVTNAGDNTLWVINTATYTVINKIATGNTPQGLSVTPDGQSIYEVNGISNDVWIINTATYAVTAKIGVGLNPFSLGNFIIGGTGCAGVPVKFTITVKPIPNITSVSAPATVNTIYGTPSSSSSFTLSGTNLSGILITPPVGFEVSTDNITFTNTVIAGGGSNLTDVPVYIRLSSLTAAGNYSGNIVLSSSGAANVNIIMPGSKVSPAPLTIQANDTSKTYGSVLSRGTSSTAFNITSGVLKNGNTISSVSLTYGAGAAATAPVGTYPTISSAVSTGGNGFLSGNYTINYLPGSITVTPASLTITANNINKTFGTVLVSGIANTAFTSVGLLNKETVGSATMTYGNGAAEVDPVGFYPGSITPSSAGGGTFNAGNYTIIYQTGDIMVEPLPASIAIPNTFTPNGDGVNDFWDIPALASYNNCSVFIYSRWGTLVYHSIGYARPWNGTINGKNLPVSTYYYIIKFGTNTKSLSGSVTIIR
jgi:gliding motility-associated-like protein